MGSQGQAWRCKNKRGGGAARRLQQNSGEADGLERPETNKQTANPSCWPKSYQIWRRQTSSGPRSDSVRSRSPGVPTWEASATAPVHGNHCGSPVRGREQRDPRAAASRLSLATVQGAGEQATPTRGSGLGTLSRVNAPFRDSGERPPRAKCPGTSESRGDRHPVQSRNQSWEKKAATAAKMAGSATAYARLKTRLLLTDRVLDWVAFSLLRLIG